jgi:hypothetical protein
MGYAANAGLLTLGDSYWNNAQTFPTWQVVLNNLQWYKGAADVPPGPNSVNKPASASAADIQAAYNVQITALYDVYGISLPPVQMTCPPTS